MKDLRNYILEYKQREIKSFDYKKIEDTIKSLQSSFFGKELAMGILWRPEIHFDYSDGGWSSGKPDDDFHGGKHYKGISLGASDALFIEFYGEKKLFKDNIFEGYIVWYLPPNMNEDDTNYDELEKYLNSAANYTVPNKGNFPEFKDVVYKKIKCNSYEELEKHLKKIEEIVNKHNNKCDKNEPTYLYFSKDEATANAKFKKQEYEIISTEEKIVELNKQLKEVEKAENDTDTDLSELKLSIQKQIDMLKKIKNEK